MTKTALWWVIGGLVVIGGVAMLSGGSDTPTDSTAVGDTSEVTDNSIVASAFTGSGSIKCEYNQDGGLVGTAYVKGGKVRIEGTVEGGTANVIYGSGKVYTWGKSGGYDYGFIIDAPTAEAEVSAGAQALPSRAEIENQFNNGSTRCENFNASDSLFIPPTNVKFQNMSELLNSMPAGAGPSGY
ncbi:MAG: hypothetical protein Q7R62_00215 [bacterium]|nr:hypothetical protein [bacterium]